MKRKVIRVLGKIRLKDLSKFKLGTHQHIALTESLTERIKAFKKVLHEVEPSSIEKTIDDFMRDHHPEREIAVWEKIAERYQKKVNQKMTSEQKKELYAELLVQSMKEDPITATFDQ